MRKIGAYGAENEKLMEYFKQWLTTHDLLNEDSVILGIAQDNPALIKLENCRYDVGLIVYTFKNLYSDSDILF